MIVACPSCQKRIKAPDSAAGKKAKCPSCGTIMMLPAPVQDAEVVNQELPSTPPPNDLFAAPPAGGGLGDLLDEADDMYSLEKKPGVIGGASSDPFAASGPSTQTDASVPRRPCPACGEMIIMSALKCRFCGEAFDPGLKRRQRGGSAGDEDLSSVDVLVAILCGNIACILGIIWLIQGKPKGGKMIGLAIAANIAWAIFWGILNGILAAAGGGGP